MSILWIVGRWVHSGWCWHWAVGILWIVGQCWVTIPLSLPLRVREPRIQPEISIVMAWMESVRRYHDYPPEIFEYFFVYERQCWPLTDTWPGTATAARWRQWALKAPGSCHTWSLSICQFKSTRKLLRQVFKDSRIERKSDSNDSLPTLNYDNKDSFNPGGQV